MITLDLRSAEKSPTNTRSLILTEDFIKSKVTVTYTGNIRPLSVDRRAILDRWALLKNYDASYARLYDEEFQFLEGNRPYWLAVQRQVAKQLKKQAGADQPVDLYLLSGIGAERLNEAWDWLLLVQEYQIPKSE